MTNKNSKILPYTIKNTPQTKIFMVYFFGVIFLWSNTFLTPLHGVFEINFILNLTTNSIQFNIKKTNLNMRHSYKSIIQLRGATRMQKALVFFSEAACIKCLCQD